MMGNNESQRFPTVDDLQRRARTRLPRFVRAYMDTGTGQDELLVRNRAAFAARTLTPRLLRGPLDTNTAASLFDYDYALPIGVAPMGHANVVWPDFDATAAAAARRNNIAYCLSTVASSAPEPISAHAGDKAWFQYYPTINDSIRDDLLSRATESGFRVLVVTVDVPGLSRRESLRRSGVSMPPTVSPRLVAQSAIKPAWTYATLSRGIPNLQTIEKYAKTTDRIQTIEYYREHFTGKFDFDDLAAIRERWSGPLLLKGVLHPEDARRAVDTGVDGIIVSNHGGRQFDGAPASLDAIAPIRAEVGDDCRLVLDSGVRCGLDIIRALVEGADFVLLGRPFLYGVAALGPRGADYVIELLAEDLRVNMCQLGLASLDATALREYKMAATTD